MWYSGFLGPTVTALFSVLSNKPRPLRPTFEISPLSIKPTIPYLHEAPELVHINYIWFGIRTSSNLCISLVTLYDDLARYGVRIRTINVKVPLRPHNYHPDKALGNDICFLYNDISSMKIQLENSVTKNINIVTELT